MHVWGGYAIGVGNDGLTASCAAVAGGPVCAGHAACPFPPIPPCCAEPRRPPTSVSAVSPTKQRRRVTHPMSPEDRDASRSSPSRARRPSRSPSRCLRQPPATRGSPRRSPRSSRQCSRPSRGDVRSRGHSIMASVRAVSSETCASPSTTERSVQLSNARTWPVSFALRIVRMPLDAARTRTMPQ